MGTWFGPLFWNELRLLGRRSWLFWIRWVFFAMLVVEFGSTIYELQAHIERDPLGTRPFERFNRYAPWVQSAQVEAAASFFRSSISLLAGTLLLLTPFLVASSIANEVRAGRIDLLRVSGLHDREIIAGMFLARVCYLALYPLGTLPLLMMLTLLGGIEPKLAAGVFAMLLATMLSLAALTLLFGLRTGRSLPGALVLVAIFLAGLTLLGLVISKEPILSTTICYLTSLGQTNKQPWSSNNLDWFDGLAAYFQSVVILSNPVAARWFLTHSLEAKSGTVDWTWRVAGPYVLIHLLAAWLLLRLAERALAQAGIGRPVRHWRWFVSHHRARPYGKAPFWWKEIHTAGARWLARFYWIALPLMLLGGGGWLFLVHQDALDAVCGGSSIPRYKVIFTQEGWGGEMKIYVLPFPPILSREYENLRHDLAVACAVLLMAAALVAVVRAAMSVTSEKEKQTWDMLLTVPVPLRTLLAAKFLASLGSALPSMVVLTSIVVLSVVLDICRPGVLILLPAAAAFLLAATALGLSISVYCSTSARALLFVIFGCLIAAVMSLEDVHSLDLYSFPSSPKYSVLRGIVVGLQIITALVVPVLAIIAIGLRGPRSRRILSAILRIVAFFFFPLLIFIIGSQTAAESQALLPWKLFAMMIDSSSYQHPATVVVAGVAYLTLAIVLLAAAGGYAARASGRIELQPRRGRRQPVPR